jgi:putative ATP-binding cassette transporter
VHGAGDGPPARPLTWTLLCAGVAGSGLVSQILLGRLGQAWGYRLRTRLAAALLSMRYERLEQIGAPRLTASLTVDIDAITSASMVFPSLIISVVAAAGCLLWLGSLSLRLLLLTVACVGVGLWMVRALQATAMRALTGARVVTDELYARLRCLTDGVRELKMSHARRQHYLEQQLRPTAVALRHEVGRGLTRFALAEQGATLFMHASMGVVLFLGPWVAGADRSTLLRFALGLLYLAMPVSQIVQLSPAIGEAQVALRHIAALDPTLTSPSNAQRASLRAAARRTSLPLELREVRYRYAEQDDGGQGFAIGPIDLTVPAGELVFIVGGNGSGKTTLAMVIAGLYQPSAGSVRFAGDASLCSEARCEHVSAVFVSPFVFDALLTGASQQRRARELLVALELDEKVRIEDGRLSTLALSQGQRKRVALLLALLEDRPLYLFDEWAADQEPRFKRRFYTELLPALRRRGKAVVVITHDDRYFDVADRVLELHDGRLQPLRSPARPAAVSAG